ncbi:hypothetical protein [Desulfocurvus vexinensis]|uniref:hypothetical protein n=1 Tax=Desulfocurvus vexinensis TaxID=399548 RepID=UPI00048AE531|nr:hypothetical protein [Desulfocurvus vexinensis]
MDIELSATLGPGLLQDRAAFAARGPGSAAFPDPATLEDSCPALPEGVTSGAASFEDANAARAALEREARLQTIRDYIETCGAPEEKDQTGSPDETFWDYLQRQEDPKTRQGLPLLANQTWGMAIQDPDDQGSVHVFTVKTDKRGKAKITRHMEFDSGDGQDRSKLTRRRAEDATAPGDSPEQPGAQAAAPAAQSAAARSETRARRADDRQC